MPHYDVAVLGAGPSGLTAAYSLSKAGARVAVIERDAQSGGLMRGICRGDCVFDLGRKELYNRFPEVHQLWTGLLGTDYREYAHRVGLLYGGRILEKDSIHRGKLRGMAPLQVAQMGASYLASQLRPGSRRADSLADYYTLRYGRAYYNTFVSGFREKFEGRSGAELPNTEGEREVERFHLLRPDKEVGAPTVDALFAGQARWWHPRRGTQQIVDRLEEESRASGADFLHSTEVLAIEPASESTYALRLRKGAVASEISARFVVSSLPMQILTKVLQTGLGERLRTPPREEMLFRKSTALVYLVADGEPSFPHNWLEVTDPQLQMARVVNYATWNGNMIPKGKTGLCVEYFALEGDPLMALSSDDLLQLAISEATACGLLDASRVEDSFVLRLPNINASTVIHDRKQEWIREVSEHLEHLPRFFDINRPGMDRATLAGIDVAAACLSDAPMSRRSLADSSRDL